MTGVCHIFPVNVTTILPNDLLAEFPTPNGLKPFNIPWAINACCLTIHTGANNKFLTIKYISKSFESSKIGKKIARNEN